MRANFRITSDSGIIMKMKDSYKVVLRYIPPRGIHIYA